MSWLHEFYRQHPDYRRLHKKHFVHAVHFEIAPGLWEAHIRAEPHRGFLLARLSPFATDYPGAASFGQVYSSDADYATARSTATGHGTSQGTYNVGQQKSGSTYWVYRLFFQFDTSGIGAGSTVTQVNLKLVCTTDSSATDFDVQIVKQDWSGQDPLSAGNRETAYDNCLAGTLDGGSPWRNTSGMSTNTQYASPNLDTAWVNKSGTTYYSLRSDRDASGTTPTGTEYAAIATPANATVGYRPVLTVLYTTGKKRSYAVIAG